MNSEAPTLAMKSVLSLETLSGQASYDDNSNSAIAARHVSNNTNDVIRDIQSYYVEMDFNAKDDFLYSISGKNVNFLLKDISRSLMNVDDSNKLQSRRIVGYKFLPRKKGGSSFVVANNGNMLAYIVKDSSDKGLSSNFSKNGDSVRLLNPKTASRAFIRDPVTSCNIVDLAFSWRLNEGPLLLAILRADGGLRIYEIIEERSSIMCVCRAGLNLQFTGRLAFDLRLFWPVCDDCEDDELSRKRAENLIAVIVDDRVCYLRVDSLQSLYSNEPQVIEDEHSLPSSVLEIRDFGKSLTCVSFSPDCSVTIVVTRDGYVHFLPFKVPDEKDLQDDASILSHVLTEPKKLLGLEDSVYLEFFSFCDSEEDTESCWHHCVAFDATTSQVVFWETVGWTPVRCYQFSKQDGGLWSDLKLSNSLSGNILLFSDTKRNIMLAFYCNITETACDVTYVAAFRTLHPSLEAFVHRESSSEEEINLDLIVLSSIEVKEMSVNFELSSSMKPSLKARCADVGTSQSSDFLANEDSFKSSFLTDVTCLPDTDITPSSSLNATNPFMSGDASASKEDNVPIFPNVAPPSLVLPLDDLQSFTLVSGSSVDGSAKTSPMERDVQSKAVPPAPVDTLPTADEINELFKGEKSSGDTSDDIGGKLEVSNEENAERNDSAWDSRSDMIETVYVPADIEVSKGYLGSLSTSPESIIVMTAPDNIWTSYSSSPCRSSSSSSSPRISFHSGSECVDADNEVEKDREDDIAHERVESQFKNPNVISQCLTPPDPNDLEEAGGHNEVSNEAISTPQSCPLNSFGGNRVHGVSTSQLLNGIYEVLKNVNGQEKKLDLLAGNVQNIEFFLCDEACAWKNIQDSINSFHTKLDDLQSNMSTLATNCAAEKNTKAASEAYVKAVKGQTKVGISECLPQMCTTLSSKVLGSLRTEITQQLEITRKTLQKNLLDEIKLLPSSPAMTQKMTKVMSSSVLPLLKTTLRDNIANDLAPAIDQTLKRVFHEINDAFRQGTNSYLMEVKGLLDRQRLIIESQKDPAVLHLTEVSHLLKQEMQQLKSECAKLSVDDAANKDVLLRISNSLSCLDVHNVSLLDTVKLQNSMLSDTQLLLKEQVETLGTEMSKSLSQLFGSFLEGPFMERLQSKLLRSEESARYDSRSVTSSPVCHNTEYAKQSIVAKIERAQYMEAFTEAVWAQNRVVLDFLLRHMSVDILMSLTNIPDKVFLAALQQLVSVFVSPKSDSSLFQCRLDFVNALILRVDVQSPALSQHWPVLSRKLIDMLEVFRKRVSPENVSKVTLLIFAIKKLQVR